MALSAREVAAAAVNTTVWMTRKAAIDRLTVAIETRDREAEAREAGLRAEVETIAESPFGTPSWEQRRTAQFALADEIFAATVGAGDDWSTELAERWKGRTP